MPTVGFNQQQGLWKISEPTCTARPGVISPPQARQNKPASLFCALSSQAGVRIRFGFSATNGLDRTSTLPAAP
jgi:hypothetical protein